MALRLAQDRAPNNAVVAQSVVALVTRQGNPKRIQDWHDLTRSALMSCRHNLDAAPQPAPLPAMAL